jgi:hypothetical protein
VYSEDEEEDEDEDEEEDEEEEQGQQEAAKDAAAKDAEAASTDGKRTVRKKRSRTFMNDKGFISAYSQSPLPNANCNYTTATPVSAHTICHELFWHVVACQPRKSFGRKRRSMKTA